MTKLIVRSLSKGRVSVSFRLLNQSNRFERSEIEPVEDFLKRLKVRYKDQVKTVSLLDSCNNNVSLNLSLISALTPGNYLYVDSERFDILIDPPSIESVEIYRASSFFVGSCVFANITAIKVDDGDICYTWEISKTKNGEFKQISCGRYLYLTDELDGYFIRLSCYTKDVDRVQSQIVGPVKIDPSFRRLISRARPRPSSVTSRVMSYNILAQSFMESQKKPKINWFPYCPREFQARSYREPRIAAEIRAHDADIVCMQEVEGHAFDETLTHMLPEYLGNLQTVMKGRTKVGCCVLYKRALYEELSYETVELPQQYCSTGDLADLGIRMKEKFPEFMVDIAVRPILSQIIVLKSTATGGILVVGNTHLFWDPKYSRITFLHAHGLCTRLERTRRQFEGARVVLCGDMNSQKTSLVHSYFTRGFVDSDGSALGDYFAAEIRNPLSLTSARGDPNYTNYTATFRDVIDYILCDSQSKVVAVTPSPELCDLEQSEGCPSEIFPSDHLPIISDIDFT